MKEHQFLARDDEENSRLRESWWKVEPENRLFPLRLHTLAKFKILLRSFLLLLTPVWHMNIVERNRAALRKHTKNLLHRKARICGRKKSHKLNEAHWKGHPHDTKKVFTSLVVRYDGLCTYCHVPTHVFFREAHEGKKSELSLSGLLHLPPAHQGRNSCTAQTYEYDEPLLQHFAKEENEETLENSLANDVCSLYSCRLLLSPDWLIWCDPITRSGKEAACV